MIFYYGSIPFDIIKNKGVLSLLYWKIFLRSYALYSIKSDALVMIYIYLMTV